MNASIHNPPARLNGYPVLHSQPDGENFRVLVFREGHEVHPFVVATWVPADTSGGWFHGDYLTDLPSAMALFEPAKPAKRTVRIDGLRRSEGSYEPASYRADMIDAGRGHLLP
jgi:hypothetical protein